MKYFFAKLEPSDVLAALMLIMGLSVICIKDTNLAENICIAILGTVGGYMGRETHKKIQNPKGDDDIGEKR